MHMSRHRHVRVSGSHSHLNACLRDLLIKVETLLSQCELEVYDLIYFISVYHTDLLYEKFQPQNSGNSEPNWALHDFCVASTT